MNLPDMHGSDVLKGGAKSYLTKPLGIIAFLKEVDLYVG